MVEGYEGVGFTPTEGCLELYHRVAALTLESVTNDIHYVPESTGHVGFPEEDLRVPVLGRRIPHVDAPQVGCEHVQGESFPHYILMGFSNTHKWFHFNILLLSVIMSFFMD